MTSNEVHSPRQSRNFWQEHTNQWNHSGLTKIAYCQQHNLKPASFYHWSKKLEHAGSPLPPRADTPRNFVPVQIDRSAVNVRNNTEFVHIERAATEIALPIDLSGEQIHSGLQAIHALHV